MVKIRLARFGKKKQPTYRIVVSDVRKDTHGTYIESLGNYNPSVQPKEISINVERAKYWLSQGAQPTDVVHNLFVDHDVIDAKKRSVSKRYVPKEEASPEEDEQKDMAQDSDNDSSADKQGDGEGDSSKDSETDGAGSEAEEKSEGEEGETEEK